MTFLTGWVHKTYPSNKDGGAVFEIKDKMGDILKCYTLEFCPVWVGDVIAGEAEIGTSGYIFRKNPIVKLNISEEEVIKCIIKSQEFGIRKDFAKKVYDSIVLYHETSNVDSILNTLSINYMEKQDDNMQPLKDYLNETQAKKLLKWWYKTRVLRKLYLFGLNNKDIKETKMDPDELYQQCLIDSFLVVSIPIDKCKKIYDILYKKYTDDQLFRAVVARKLYHNTTDKSWVGTPTKIFEASFKDIDKKLISTHMDILKKDYGIKTELFTVYLKEQYEAEKKASDVVNECLSNNDNTSTLNYYYHEKLAKMKQPIVNSNYTIEFNNKNLNPQQIEAVESALKKKLSIITGGAGTGKTTVIKELIHNLDNLGIPYIVASYTGKAVARIKEVIKKNSPMTIHMMLSRSKSITPFKFAIFDESSMITTDLMYMFWKTFGTAFSMCFIGDNNQLPPISCGNFFDQIIKSQKVDIYKLTKNHRSNDITGIENNIVYNSENLINYIKEMEYNPDDYMEPFRFKTNNNGNFHMLDGNDETIYKCIHHLANNGIKATDITVITPYTKNLDTLNKNIQKIYDMKTKNYTDSKGITWSIGDRVMITKNNYMLNQMNGDEGIITDITETPGESGFHEMLIEFLSGNEYKFVITYEKTGINNLTEIGFDNHVIVNNPTVDILTHCYAITIHKSQGSEWDYIIFYLPKNESGNTSFINKYLIYTAITRAKKMIWIIGDIQMLEIHSTMNPGYRHDTLCQRLLL